MEKNVFSTCPSFTFGNVREMFWQTRRTTKKSWGGMDHLPILPDYLRRKHFTEAEWKNRRDNARSYPNFICELYRKHFEGGLYFVHDHPTIAGSRGEIIIQETLGQPDDWVVKTNMSRFGMTTERAGHAS